MSSVLPKALEELISAFSTLPGVGNKTAERYAYSLFKRDLNNTDKIISALSQLHSSIKTCPKTFALIDSNLTYSTLYTDPSRDKTIVAVVAEPFDIIAIEKSGSFKGTYHVLGGLISPIDGIGPETLSIDELRNRINEDNVKEIILATSASVEGDTTSFYIQNKVKNIKNLKITKLARGLPIGLDLEYADVITLSRAFEGRTDF